ncbi:MAG: hypothetical protein KDB22_27060, partial [Planctomycetales bacterium]|nr:hypothetical protein [Planctomycetales bacterium]
QQLIGMFGIGLFSAFMIAQRMIVESRRVDCNQGVRWEADGGTDIVLSSWQRESAGTTVRLELKPQFHSFSKDAGAIEVVLKEYTDFLTIPIHLNDSVARVNLINASWFDPTPELEAIELELASYFDESPLDVIPVQIRQPTIHGALYISPQRTPGFADEAVVTATQRRMVISRRLRGLLPAWASFLRGVLELKDCSPTASREDLVRDENFAIAAHALEAFLFARLEQLADNEPVRLQSILAWHRYTFAGAALTEPRLRALLRRAYLFSTSQGQLTFNDIIQRSAANPIFEMEADYVVWYNTDRRQEGWINSLFNDHEAPCVHTLRSFEESLLASMVADISEQAEMRFASPASPSFAAEILQMDDMQDAAPEWADFFRVTEAIVRVAEFDANQPVMAFLNERHELKKTFEDLKKNGVVPSGFQRLIDQHFEQGEQARNEILLNRNHRLVARAMEQKTNSPLASVLRLLVVNALRTAGASITTTALHQQQGDLDWIADCLWGQKT